MTQTDFPSSARFNVLLTEDRPRPEEYWTSQLGRLLEPQGVASFVARSGQEAVGLAAEREFHAAVIDLGTPKAQSEPGESGKSGEPGKSAATPYHTPTQAQQGLWLMELMRRLPNRPPVVVLRNPAFSSRQANRLMRDLLHLGAFSVLVKPVELDELLAVFQRLVERRYQGYWPGTASDTPGASHASIPNHINKSPPRRLVRRLIIRRKRDPYSPNQN